MSSREFKNHIKREHSLSTLSVYLKEIVYGGVDGIVTTFAVVAGFAGAQGDMSTGFAISSVAVLLFGFANLFADGVSMGLGNVLSIRADKDVYTRQKRRELSEIHNNTESEMSETVHILCENGFSAEDARAMTKLYAKNPKYWADFMMSHELEMGNPEHDNPWFTGLATFIAFVLFGAIPLAPFVIWGDAERIFLVTSIFTFGALMLLGVLRWRTTHESVIRSVGEIVLLGSISATVAYMVGTFFR